MLKYFYSFAGLFLVVFIIFVMSRASGLSKLRWVALLPFAWIGRLVMYSKDIRSRVDIRAKGIWVRRAFFAAIVVLLWWNVWGLRYLQSTVPVPSRISVHQVHVDLEFWKEDSVRTRAEDSWFVFDLTSPIMFVVGNNELTAVLIAIWFIGWASLCSIPAQMMKVDDFRAPINMRVVKDDGTVHYDRMRFGLLEIGFNTIKKVKGYIARIDMINSVSYVVHMHHGAQTDQSELSVQIPTMEVATGLTFGGITQMLNAPNSFHVRVSRGLPIIRDKMTGEIRGNVSIHSMPVKPDRYRRWLRQVPNPASRWEFALALDPEVVWSNLKQNDVNYGIFGKMGLGKTRLFTWIVRQIHTIDRLTFTVLIDLSKEGRGLHAYQYDQDEINSKPDGMLMRDHMNMLRPLPNFLLITTMDELNWFLDGLKWLEEFRSQMIKDHPGTEKISDFEDINDSPWVGSDDFDVFDPLREFRILYAVEEVGSTWRQFAGSKKWEELYSEICGFVFRCRDMKFNAAVLTQHPTIDEIGRIRPYLTRCGFGLDFNTNQFVYGMGFIARQAGGLFSIMRGDQSNTIGFAIAPNCHPAQMSVAMSRAVELMTDEELKECLMLKRLFMRQHHPQLLKRMRDLKARAHKAHDVEIAGTWQQNRDERKKQRAAKAERMKQQRQQAGPVERRIDFRRRRN